MLVLSRRDVEALLDLDALIDALADAHAELSRGDVSMPARIAAFAPDGLLGAMPAYLPSAGLGAKLVSLFPKNAPPIPTHQAAIVLFDGETGMVTAVMDGTYITAMRTAAAAALATRLLAREDAKVLAILGTGVQGQSAQEMFPRARDFAEIRFAGRGEFEGAARGADVVHVATHSAEPVVMADWLADCVESRDSSFAPPPGGASELAGLDPAAVVELGELVSGRPGRGGPTEITLYKSVGVAIQDLAAAALVLRAARERNIGLEIELEEMHA
jgi:alanine dehydrogenase